MKNERDEQTRRKQALKWLSTVRQATVDVETAAAYLTGLEDIPARVVEQACKDIGVREREAYEGAWPALGTIRARCQSIQRVESERLASRKLLMPPSGKPISPEQWDDIKAKFQAAIRRGQL